MNGTRITPRTIWIILADAAIIYGGVVLALYLRLGSTGSDYELNERNGWLKIILATLLCLLILYFYDLYDFTVMSNRRELMLRMVQALGIAWALLALLFYFVPPLFIGRGVSVISVPVVLVLLLTWRILIHWLTGHPEIGEKILIFGTGRAARDTAESIWERRDAGYRIVGFITENGAQPQDMPPRINLLGSANNLEEIIKNEKINRVVIAVRERRGTFPTDTLLKMSLAGDVNIEECTSFFERVTGQVHIDMVRPSWLIFEGRGRDTQLGTFVREVARRRRPRTSRRQRRHDLVPRSVRGSLRVFRRREEDPVELRRRLVHDARHGLSGRGRLRVSHRPHLGRRIVKNSRASSRTQ